MGNCGYSRWLRNAMVDVLVKVWWVRWENREQSRVSKFLSHQWYGASSFQREGRLCLVVSLFGILWNYFYEKRRIMSSNVRIDLKVHTVQQRLVQFINQFSLNRIEYGLYVDCKIRRNEFYSKNWLFILGSKLSTARTNLPIISDRMHFFTEAIFIILVPEEHTSTPLLC